MSQIRTPLSVGHYIVRLALKEGKSSVFSRASMEGPPGRAARSTRRRMESSFAAILLELGEKSGQLIIEVRNRSERDTVISFSQVQRVMGIYERPTSK